MMINRVLLLLILLLSVTACQRTKVQEPLPTLVRLPTLVTNPPTAPIVTVTPTVTATATPSATITTTPSPTDMRSFEIVRAEATVGASPTPLPQRFIFGQSAENRELVAYRIGTGGRTIMLIGGIHAGFEQNTITLVEELRDHFTRSSDDILPEITLLVIPVFNPDGYSRGRVLAGRFNGNNVDLNRNWGCGWSADAEYFNGAVNPGSAPFSEPETIALGSLIQRVQPYAVLFYHSAAAGVYAGHCEGEAGASEDLSALYGQAAGYSSGQAFSAYTVTGTAPSWVDSLGIASADVELATTTSAEFTRNLRAVLAVQQWVAAQP